MSAQFKVLDAQGVAIPINTLDEEACELWGIEVHPKEYATPFKRKFTNPDNLEGRELALAELRFQIDAPTLNWFDMIGSKIAFNHSRAVTWSMIREEIVESVIVYKLLEGSKLVDTEKVDDVPVLKEDISVAIACGIEFVRPFIELINLWESQGYSPVKL